MIDLFEIIKIKSISDMLLHAGVFIWYCEKFLMIYVSRETFFNYYE